MLMPTERPCHKEYSCAISSSSTHCSKVISKVKVLRNQIKLQGQGHRVKNVSTHIKVLSQGVPCDIKALALMVEKLLARLKFQTESQN